MKREQIVPTSADDEAQFLGHFSPLPSRHLPPWDKAQAQVNADVTAIAEAIPIRRNFVTVAVHYM